MVKGSVRNRPNALALLVSVVGFVEVDCQVGNCGIRKKWQDMIDRFISYSMLFTKTLE